MSGDIWVCMFMRIMGACRSLKVSIDRYGRLFVSISVWGYMGVYGWLWEFIGVCSSL